MPRGRAGEPKPPPPGANTRGYDAFPHAATKKKGTHWYAKLATTTFTVLETRLAGYCGEDGGAKITTDGDVVNPGWRAWETTWRGPMRHARAHRPAHGRRA